MAKVIGLGGVFFKTRDPDALARWYQDALGLDLNELGGADFAHADTVAAHGPNARAIWAPFKAQTGYFAPSVLDVMVNLIVDDLPGVLARAEAAGAEIIGDIQHFSYGDFGWVMDPDGRKIELWQPAPPDIDGFEKAATPR